MTNYTTETYQTKRDILNFSQKISTGVRKPVMKMTKDMTYGILASRNCQLTKIASSLKEKDTTKLANTVDRLSTNLNNLDIEDKKILIKNYYKEIMKYLPEDSVIVLNDDTDINKEYSKKLENLCTVRDASSQIERYVNGYKVCEYVALTEKTKTPVSLYSKIYSTESDNFVSENEETKLGEKKVISILKQYNKKPIFVRDRGYDANEFLISDIKNDIKFVTRLKGNRHLLFKEKKRIVEKVAKERKGKIVTKLIYRGENKECSISYTKVKLPIYKEKDITLVTIHGLSDDGIPMMLLTNLDVNDKVSAEHIVRLYFLRWRIEEYFKAKKSFNWENSLLRTLESMNNLNLFLTMAMTHIAILVEKKDKNFHSNIILERANSIKKEYLVYLSTMATGIVEILKYARTGIRDWHTKKDKNKGQLQFKLILE